MTQIEPPPVGWRWEPGGAVGGCWLCGGRKDGHAAGSSNFQTKRRRLVVALGRFLHGHGGQTQEDPAELVIPPDRGEFQRRERERERRRLRVFGLNPGDS